jgi:hypothetical protein
LKYYLAAIPISVIKYHYWFLIYTEVAREQAQRPTDNPPIGFGEGANSCPKRETINFENHEQKHSIPEKGTRYRSFPEQY